MNDIANLCEIVGAEVSMIRKWLRKVLLTTALAERLFSPNPTK